MSSDHKYFDSNGRVYMIEVFKSGSMSLSEKSYRIIKDSYLLISAGFLSLFVFPLLAPIFWLVALHKILGILLGYRESYDATCPSCGYLNTEIYTDYEYYKCHRCHYPILVHQLYCKVLEMDDYKARKSTVPVEIDSGTFLEEKEYKEN